MNKFNIGDWVKVTRLLGDHNDELDEQYLGTTGTILDDRELRDVKMDIDESIRVFEESQLELHEICESPLWKALK